jgi:streptogramin lyase
VADAAGKVVRVDPGTGEQTLITAGGSLVNTHGIAIEPTGNLLVADNAAFDGNGGVIRMDPTTGCRRPWLRGAASSIR